MLKELASRMKGVFSNALIGGPGVQGVFGRNPPKLGTTELLELYNQSPWLRAVVHKIAFSVAEVRWQLFVVNGRNGEPVRMKSLQRSYLGNRQNKLQHLVDIDKARELDDHPLLDLLHSGNSDMLGFNVMKVTQEYMDLVGEAFWLIERDGIGTPIQVWPLPPHWVKEFPTQENPFYKVSSRISGLQVSIPVTEIVYFNDPDPYNPYGRGSGTAKSLGDELEIDEYAAKHNKSFFYNRARPDLIVSGDNISQTDTQRLEQQWLEKHQGFWRAFKPLFFSRKIDVKEIGQSMESLQMVQLRKHERDTFINVFGVPPEKLGVIGDSKRSTIAAADFFWTKDVLTPRLEVLRVHMQERLIPMFDNRLIVDFDTPVVQDEEFDLERMKASPHAFTINEWRKKSSFQSLDGDQGEQLLAPLNSVMIPINGAEPLTIINPNLRPDEGGTGEPAPDTNESGGDKSIGKLEKEVLSRLQKELPNLIKTEADKAIKEYEE
jgi:HK97 family phage portal protein